LIELGKQDDGVRELRHLIQRYPHSNEALQARDRLRKLGIASSTGPESDRNVERGRPLTKTRSGSDRFRMLWAMMLRRFVGMMLFGGRGNVWRTLAVRGRSL